MRKLSILSIYIMMVTIAAILVWFLGFVVISTFELSVFDQRTTTFALTALPAALTVVTCAAFLNVSLNVSRIADARDAQSTAEPLPWRRWLAGFAVAGAVVLAVLFGGDAYSRRSNEREVLAEAADIMRRYRAPIERVGTLGADPSAGAQVSEILRVLASQKDEFSQLSAVFPGRVHGALVFYEVTQYGGGATSEPKEKTFFRCNNEQSAYLTRVFLKGDRSVRYEAEGGQHVVFQPVAAKGGGVFVIVMSQHSKAGRLSS